MPLMRNPALPLNFGRELRLAQLRRKRGIASPLLEEKVEQIRSHLAGLAPLEPLAVAASAVLVGSEELDRAASTIGGLGWTVPGWATYDQVANFALKPDRRSLDQAMLRAYARRPARLAELEQSTLASPLLTKWARLYRQATFLVRRRQYLPVVPSLLLILEGIVVTSHGLTTTSKQVRHAVRQLTAEDAGRIRCAWCSLESFLDDVYGDEPSHQTSDATIGRHAVMHGRSLPLWHRADCLRLMQAIETAVLILPFVKLKVL